MPPSEVFVTTLLTIATPVPLGLAVSELQAGPHCDREHNPILVLLDESSFRGHYL